MQTLSIQTQAVAQHWFGLPMQVIINFQSLWHINVYKFNQNGIHSYVHTAIAKLLIEKGANVNRTNKDNYTPLIQAADNGKKLICIASGVRWFSYHFFTGRTDLAELLIEKGAVLNFANKDGVTALMYSSRNGTCHSTLIQPQN